MDFKAYTLCSPEDSGSELFSPIVGNRFFHLSSHVAKYMVLLYLEDVRDGKKVPGLNRLEYSVQEGYLNPQVEAEEAAYALM